MLDARERRQLLQAMGIDVYVLRAADGAAAAPAPDAAGVALVVACAADAEAPRTRLRTLLPHALGLAEQAIVWIEPAAGGALPEPPAAMAYLALGADMPRALGAQLSTVQQMSALIAAADAPSICLRDALAKRALWQALKPLARHLRRVART